MLKTLVCNWKMNGTIGYCDKIKQVLSKENHQKLFNVVICPPFTLLHQLIEKNFWLGAQDCSAEHENYYTGEVSIEMLKEMHVSHVIIGHSERRKHLGETTGATLRKMSVILENGLTPIVCVKKVSEDRGYINDVYNTFLSFTMFNKDCDAKIYVAYEPEASIGSGIPDTLYSIEENCYKLKEIFKNNPKINVLYGGSVNHQNINDILQLCDGALLGKASINFDEFLKILQVSPDWQHSQIEGQKTCLHQGLSTYCN